MEERVEGTDDLDVLRAAGFGFGAAVDSAVLAAHDDDVERRAFAAAKAVGVAAEEGIQAALDAESLGARAEIGRRHHSDAGAA